MSLLLQTMNLKPFLNPLSATLNPLLTTTRRRNPSSVYLKTLNPKPLILLCSSSSSDSTRTPNPKPKRKQQRSLSSNSNTQEEGLEQKPTEETFPTTIPRKPRPSRGGGRKTEADAVEDFVRDSLEKTFASIRQQNADVLDDKEKILKEKIDVDDDEADDDVDVDVDVDVDGDGGGTEKKKEVVVEEEDPNWPLDADVGWGISASEYFDKHSIRNVIGEDGVEIDWEGEVDDNFVKEINCLEWESFAFHPSPLIVLVFERYNRATDNWKLLKELEKATKVYWCAKDRLPPRTVKIDINIERDLAYALKVKECPQLLFLRGNTILYREKEFRTSEELVLMIAHFYYNAKKPSWIDNAALAPSY